MKKKIEADLISIAHRILQLKDHTTLPELQEEARQLYEKLTILNFAESHFEGPQPTIGQVYVALEESSEPIVSEESTTTIAPEVLEEKLPQEPIITEESVISSEEITAVPEEQLSLEPILEKEITSDKQKDISTVEETETTSETEKALKELSEEPLNASKDKPEFVIDKVNADISEDMFVPATAEEINAILRGETFTKSPAAGQSDYQKNDMQDVTPDNKIEDDRPKSLNDSLKKNINIGLNDRLAFIKHLFDGSSADYNRVLSQLNTIDNSSEAMDFIQNMVKPDHDNWNDKQEYEERFIQIVSAKFD